MTDWDKLKVTELKDELKARGLPLTGLKLKQQLIDKLIEVESVAQDGGETAGEKTNGAIEEVERDEPIKPAQAETVEEAAQEDDGNVNNETDDAQVNIAQPGHSSEKPPELKEEDSQAPEEETTEQPADETPVAETKDEATEIQANDVLVPEPEQMEVEDKPAEETSHTKTQNEISDQLPPSEELSIESAKEETEQLKPDKQPIEIVQSDASTPHIAPYEILEDQRSRKRRSVTPTPSLTEVHKKAKSASGEAIVTKIDSSREASVLSSRRQEQERVVEEDVKSQNNKQGTERIEETTAEVSLRSESRSRSEQPDVAPAMHPATRSLYIRGFKRPLHIPTLRAYLSSTARSPSSDSAEDPVKFFYLDSIRTHGFVTFGNISAASRVRNSMHETRFPDEPQRDPLWIDFVPDEKVQDWAEQESGNGSGGAFGRNSGGRGKFEVIYNKNENGNVGAVLQEIDSAMSQQQRHSLSSNINNRTSVSQRQQSFSSDPPRPAAIASGIHPDRAPMVPKSPTMDRREPPLRERDDYPSRRRPSSPPRRQSHSNRESSGRGFAALDTLFSSTNTKPKLYYKLPAQHVIDDRLDLIRNLYPDRGASGDPGMKRYTFETSRGGSAYHRGGAGRAEWVDAGPEFGHGRKGQDRLEGGGGRGFKGGRGWFRGRGGRGGGFGRLGGDSYRGSAA